jgi:hypothetical protein
LRRRRAGTLLALVGFVVFTVESSTRAGADPHANRKLYERIMRARERVEYLRDGHPVWFWYDEHDPDFSDYVALNSTYVGAYSWLEPKQDFPQGGCGRRVELGDLIVVSSRNRQAPEVARTILAGCWSSFGIKPAVEEVDVLQSGDRPYTVTMLKADADLLARRPLGIVFDSTGRPDLRLVGNFTAPVPFPLDRWTVYMNQKSDIPTVKVASAGLAVRTPRRQYALALTYAPLIAPESGRYRFALKYRPGSGHFSFGARAVDESGWLGQDIAGHPAGSSREVAFWVNLMRGDTILLRISNNNDAGDGAASFVMEQLTGIKLLDPAGIPEAPSP